MVLIVVMLIWILVLLVMASGVGLGLRLGAICSAISFVGILFGMVFAHLAGKLFKPLIAHVVTTNPLTLWSVPTIVGFLVVYALFVAVGVEVHRRVGVYYKYKAGDLRLALWERLNLHLGASVGILNGVAWLVLICFFLFNLSYLTAQVASSQSEPKWAHVVNNLGNGMQSTGLDKAGRAVGSIPDSYYRRADFAGLLRQNPRLAARLADYPGFISLTERSDVQQLAQDSSLVQEWDSQAPLDQILDNGQIQSTLKNTNLINTVMNLVQANMDDITNYLISGRSPKYDSEKIIGRWEFDVVPALGALLESNPKIRPNELKNLRALWNQAYANTTFVAGSDGQAFLKSLPDFKKNPVETNTWTGQWTDAGSTYDLSLSLNNQTKVGTAASDGLRLTIKMGDDTYVFQRTY
jgi:hypothetical protein